MAQQHGTQDQNFNQTVTVPGLVTTETVIQGTAQFFPLAQHHLDTLKRPEIWGHDIFLIVLGAFLGFVILIIAKKMTPNTEVEQWEWNATIISAVLMIVFLLIGYFGNTKRKMLIKSIEKAYL